MLPGFRLYITDLTPHPIEVQINLYVNKYLLCVTQFIPNIVLVAYSYEGDIPGVSRPAIWTKASPTPALKKLYKLDTGGDIWRDYIEVPKNVLCIQLNGKYGKMINDSRVKLELQIDRLVDILAHQGNADARAHVTDPGRF